MTDLGLNLDDSVELLSNSAPQTQKNAIAFERRFATSAIKSAGHRYVINGSTQEGVPAEVADAKYHAAKTPLLITEGLLFLYFVSLAVATFSLAIIETDIGTGAWPVGQKTMIAITTVYGFVGLVLVGLYVYFQFQFTKVGEDQLDDLLSNSAGIATMYTIVAALLVLYFTVTTDNSADDTSLRKLMYVVFSSYGFISIIVVIRSLSRHMATHREIVVEQKWGAQIEQDFTGEGNNATQKVVHWFYFDPGFGRYIQLGFMAAYTCATLAMTIVVLVFGGIAVDHIPPFKLTYLGYFIGMGILFLFAWGMWIYWSWASKELKGSFAAHFDVYYLSHAILIGATIFMLIGYRYTYYHVPDDFFDSPPTIVPALKFAYFQKIVALNLILLPLFAMGATKGLAMALSVFPVDVHAIKARLGYNTKLA